MKLFFRWLGLALLFICLADVRAQTTPSVITMQDAATATGNGTSLIVGVSSAAPGANLGAVGIQITGTFSATVTFEATTDGTNWTAVMATNLNDDVRATTATAAGHYTILYGSAIRIRARISAYTSGTVTVKARLIPGLTAVQSHVASVHDQACWRVSGYAECFTRSIDRRRQRFAIIG